jgi:hypothetical protein
MAHIPDERLWSDWLRLYLDHCRERLSARELTELADALQSGVSGVELSQKVSMRTAAEERRLIDFVAAPARWKYAAHSCGKQ